MAQSVLTIDLGAICANWRALAAMNAGETAAVVKANAYGLGAAQVAAALADAGARTFFVAQAEEGVTVRLEGFHDNTLACEGRIAMD